MNYGTTYSQDVANFAGVSVSVDHNNDIETDQVNEDSELAHSDRSKGQRVSSSAIVVSEKLDSTVVSISSSAGLGQQASRAERNS
ncbi:hypothetical protein V6N13_025369 [Hibiscus sabdariffa]